MLLPVKTAEAADAFRRAGWQVTMLPLSAFTEVELRCLGISGTGLCGGRRLAP